MLVGEVDVLTRLRRTCGALVSGREGLRKMPPRRWPALLGKGVKTEALQSTPSSACWSHFPWGVWGEGFSRLWVFSL